MEDFISLVFGQPLDAYALSVAFVVLIIAALRVSKALPNPTWVRGAVVVLSLVAMAQAMLSAGVTVQTVELVEFGEWIHQAFIVWALSAIVVELLLDHIIALMAERLLPMLEKMRAGGGP